MSEKEYLRSRETQTKLPLEKVVSPNTILSLQQQSDTFLRSQNVLMTQVQSILDSYIKNEKRNMQTVDYTGGKIMIGSLMVDGQYGLQTASVLYDFCTKNNIPFTGAIDAKVYGALLKYATVQQTRKELQDLKYIVPDSVEMYRLKSLYEAKQDETLNARATFKDSSEKKFMLETKLNKKTKQEVVDKKEEIKNISFNPNEPVALPELQKSMKDTIVYLQNPEAQKLSQNMFQTFQEKWLLTNGPGGFPYLQSFPTPQKEIFMTQIVANDSLKKDKKPLISTDGAFGTQTYRALEYLSKKLNVEPVQAILSNSIFSKVVQYAKEKLNSYTENTMEGYKDKIRTYDLSKTINSVIASYPNVSVDAAMLKGIFTIESHIDPKKPDGLWQITSPTFNDMVVNYGRYTFSSEVKKICWFNNPAELQAKYYEIITNPHKSAALSIALLDLKQREAAPNRNLYDVKNMFWVLSYELLKWYNIVADKKVFDRMKKRVEENPLAAKTIMAYNGDGYRAFLYSLKVLYVAELYR